MLDYLALLPSWIRISLICIVILQAMFIGFTAFLFALAGISLRREQRAASQDEASRSIEA